MGKRAPPGQRVEKPCFYLSFPFFPVPALSYLVTVVVKGSGRQTDNEDSGRGALLSHHRNGVLRALGGNPWCFPATPQPPVSVYLSQSPSLCLSGCVWVWVCVLAQQSRETKTLAFQPENQSERGREQGLLGIGKHWGIHGEERVRESDSLK